MFFASITRRGFSLANGFGRVPLPGLNSAGGVVRPPVHAGIVPSLLPACSAPTGVSVVPRALASSAVMAAFAPAAAVAATTPARRMRWDLIIIVSSEGGLEGQADEAAVLQVGVESVGARDLLADGAGAFAVAAEEIDELQVEAVLLPEVRTEADGVVAAALVAA